MLFDDMNNHPIISEEYDKMQRGEVYQASEHNLCQELNRMKDMCWEYNRLRPTDFDARRRMLRDILGECHDDTFIVQPFLCDFGRHIRVGKGFFANFNLTILDEATVTFGNDCFVGPNVGIYTACHSTDPVERNSRREWARPVTIGNNCWIGGGTTILPGVTIGDNCTIGAGSVVVRDIPAGSIAVGNPCRVVRTLDV